MTELDLIKQDYDLKAKVIETNYILPSIYPSICYPRIDDKEIIRRQKLMKEKMEKLQENEKEKLKAMQEYYKNQNEMITKMTDRELLEAIYRRLN